MKIGRYIIGLISGLTFGMLFAPKKGKDLRKELMDKSSKSGPDGLKVLGKAFKGAGEDALKELKSLSEHEQIAAFLELSHEKMKTFLEAAEEKGYDVATAVQEKLEELGAMAKGKMGAVKEEIADIEMDVKKKAATAKKNISFTKRRVVQKAKKAKRAVKKVANAVKKVAPKKAVPKRKKRTTKK